MAKTRAKTKILPLLPLRDVVLFPSALISLDVGRPQSLEALDEASRQDNMLFVTAQADALAEDPAESDLNTTGTMAQIRQLIHLPGGMMRVVAEGVSRGCIKNFVQQHPFFQVCVQLVAEPRNTTDEIHYALVRAARETFEVYAELQQRLSPEAMLSIMHCEAPGLLADYIASQAQFKTVEKQRLLEETDPAARLEKTIALLCDEIELLKLQRQIYAKVKTGMDKNQRDYYLREQLKVINAELGEAETGLQTDLRLYRERMEKIDFSPEAAEKLNHELRRLERVNTLSPESTVIRDYVDCVLSLPWNHKTADNQSLTHAEAILNEDHYGLDKVKERIIEFLAVRQAANHPDAPILCLMGPPGVGKTSVAKSVARALGRKYVRISLGGVRDEADIRGHRKTYIGAMPGRIIQALKQAGTANPLILLDEIDKMSGDFRGNPAAALLEVLDSEQQVAFRDHYVEIPFDLSDVLFICTANTMDAISPPLADRLEIIALSGYSLHEKTALSQAFLIPKQLKKHALTGGLVTFKVNALALIINTYTREAGVRQLERHIATICRKIVTRRLRREQQTFTITVRNLSDYLGAPKYKPHKKYDTPQIGICRGLAWTPVGGDTLSIEVNTMPGTGKFELTGNLGTVMKESAHAAIGYIRSRYERFQIHKAFYKDTDIHIHIPEGAVPKDGPSAGITMATAMISALTDTPVDDAVAMTGEITLRGRVLPVGGLKEKLLAAQQAGITKVLLPYDNAHDLEEIPSNIKSGLKLVLVKHMDEVLPEAILPKQ